MNETIYLNSEEYEFVQTLPGENMSQKLRHLVQRYMKQEGDVE